MKGNLFKAVVAVLVILTLTISDFLVLGLNIAYALDGLEDQQTSINNQMEFDAYFKEGESKTHSLQKNISEQVNLYLNVNVKDSGALSDAKIKFDNANFEIGEVQNDVIKNINKAEKTIELNPVQYGENVEIEIPVMLKRENSIDQNYFDRETTLKLTANALDANGEVKTVNKEIRVKLNWTEETDVELNSEIEKYLLLEDSKSMLQQKITTKVKNNSLPKQEETIQVDVPQIAKSMPEDIIVIKNGNKLLEGVEYNKENAKLTITYNNNANEENKIEWANKKDEYKVIYTYNKPLSQEKTTINTKVETKLYTKQDAIEKTNTIEEELEQKGEIASIKVNSTDKKYKGYMYANKGNETTYDQKYTIEISNKDAIDEIEITSEGDEYIALNEEKLSTNNATYFKEILLSKSNMTTILGENGNVTLYDENGTQIAQVNKDTQDENGIISIKRIDENGNKVDLKLQQIKIVTTKPETEGNLEIMAKKAIDSNTGYDKQTLKTINKIESNIKVGEEIAKTATNLEDTKTHAKLEINNNNLSALQENKAVQITATLQANTEEYDLYKNPSVQIILPKEIENIKINNAQTLFGDEFSIKNQQMRETEEGNKVIDIQFEGEQLNFGNNVAEGMQIVINADITIKKLTPNTQTQIKMIYTNENGNEKQYEENLDININSKPGVVTYTKVTGFNSENTELESINDEISSAKLDMNSEEKTAEVNMAVINNYDKEISSVSIVGKLPENTEEKIGDKNVKGTFETSLAEEITTNIEGTKVYYSEDAKAEANSEDWKETSENAKAYKIVVPNEEVKNGEKLEFGYKFKIPENLSYNESTYTNFKINYEYAGQTAVANSTVLLETEQKNISKTNTIAMELPKDEEKQKVEIAEGVNAEIVAISGEKYLKEGDEVTEGQTIRYEVTINNTTSEDIENLQLTAQHTNALIYGIEMKEVLDNEYDEDENQKVINKPFMSLPGLESTTINIENIASNSNKTINYEIQIQDIKSNEKTTQGTIKFESNSFDEKTINTIENKVVDGKIALTLLRLDRLDMDFYVKDCLSVELNLKNLTEEVQSNVVVKIKLPEELSYIDVEDKNRKAEITYNEETSTLSVVVDELDTQEKSIVIPLKANKFDINDDERDVSIYATTNINSKEYTSNYISYIINQLPTLTVISANQTTNNDDELLYEDDKVTFTATIQNEGKREDFIHVMDEVPQELKIENAYIVRENEETETIEVQNNVLDEFLYINPQETVKVVIETIVDLKNSQNEEISNYFQIVSTGDIINTNTITYKLYVDLIDDDEEINEPTEDDDFEEDPDPEEDFNPDEFDKESGSGDDNEGEEGEGGNSGSGEGNKPTNGSISGTVWKDFKKDGKKDENDKALSNIKVYLIDANTGNSVKNNKNEKISATTNDKGEYNLTNLSKGKYYVAFEYDTNKYRTTQYKKQDASESENSDVISKRVVIDGETKTIAITDIITLGTKGIQNIDAGFIENEIFDLNLQKYISKITIQNKQGTIVKEYDKTQLAKVELDKKYLANSTIILEYTINIKNEGELDGYVGEVVDYIPKDLKFSSEINKDWYLSTDGNLHNVTLANETIGSGKTKTLTLTLTKTMTNDNTGTIINTAEIAKQSNTLGIEDIDSVAGNNKQGEDDLSTAEVIISIRTGAVIISIIGILSLMTIIAVIIYILKRKAGEKIA